VLGDSCSKSQGGIAPTSTPSRRWTSPLPPRRISSPKTTSRKKQGIIINVTCQKRSNNILRCHRNTIYARIIPRSQNEITVFVSGINFHEISSLFFHSAGFGPIRQRPEAKMHFTFWQETLVLHIKGQHMFQLHYCGRENVAGGGSPCITSSSSSM
jgi:hypothetical protein